MGYETGLRLPSDGHKWEPSAGHVVAEQRMDGVTRHQGVHLSPDMSQQEWRDKSCEGGQPGEGLRRQVQAHAPASEGGDH